MDACTRFSLYSKPILKASGGFLVVFQNCLAIMINCRNAYQNNNVCSPGISFICLKYVKRFHT